MQIDITKTLIALEIYADSNPHSGSERQLLKLTTIGDGKTALTCVSEKSMTTREWLASALGFGSYKLRKIADFLSTDEFCQALKKTTGFEENLGKLKKATTYLETGISTHNKKPWFLRLTIRSDLHKVNEILNDKVARVAQPFIITTPSQEPTRAQTPPVEPPPTKAENEIKRLKASKALSPVEQRFVIKLQPNLSPRDVIKAQTEALQNLKPDQQNDDNAIIKAKQDAVLKVCNATDEKWEGAISALEAAYSEAQKVIPPTEAPKTRNIPDLAHKQLQNLLSKSVKTGLEVMVDRKIDARNNLSTSQENWTTQADSLKLQAEEYVDICLDNLEPRYAFYEKWGAYQKAEMIQGFKDPGETLGAGICWALSLRWCIAELEKSDSVDAQDMVSTMDIGESTVRDRFNQAFLHMITQGSAIDSPELQTLKNRHNIVKTHRFEWGKNIKSADLKEILKNHLPDENLIANNGVGQLCFWWKDEAHAISICCQPDSNDPQKSVFRFSDPNLGTFHFPVPTSDDQHTKTLNKYVECLTELLTTFYSDDFKKISCFCFEQGRPQVVVQ